MENIARRLFIEPFESFYEKVIHYLPNVMSFLLILVFGLILGKLLKVVSLHFFRLLRVDAMSERSGLKDVLLKGGVRDNLSTMLSRLVEYLTIFVFLIIALGVLEVPEVERLLGNFFLYLPNILVATAILIIGYMLGNFLGRAALITAVNSGLPMSGPIGKLVKYAVFILAATMALEQLGIGKDTIIVAFTIIFGGVVLALSIAFGLGGKEFATEYLSRKLGKRKEEKQEKEDDIRHI